MSTPVTTSPVWPQLATVATIVLFIITAVTGLMLLLGVGRAQVSGAHEWLGAAFVAASLAHSWRHLAPIGRYLRSRLFVVSAGLALVACAAFVVPSLLSARGGNPIRQAVGAVVQAPLSRVASLLAVDPQALRQRLQQRGIEVAEGDPSIDELAKRTGRESPEILAIVLGR